MLVTGEASNFLVVERTEGLIVCHYFRMECLSIREELYQHRGKDMRINRVGLALQGEALRIGQDVGDRLCCVVHPGRTPAAVHDERRYRDGGPLPWCEWPARHIVTHDGAVIGECVR